MAKKPVVASEKFVYDTLTLLQAYGVILRALVHSHPNQQAFAQCFEVERQKTLAHLLNSSIDERSIDAFMRCIAMQMQQSE